MLKCIRCEEELVPDGHESSEVDFYSCPNCGSGYSKSSSGALCDRWMMPITLPLYGVIFDEDPEPRSSEVADSLLKDCDQDMIAKIIEHIDDEIERPKQKVSDTLDFVHPNEDNLRGFLRGVSAELKKLKA